ncbi:MAG TPA: hypothetical protein VJN18_24935 [Polyangiaceae bacterium]|nr:hypothetical protein [Polyangiaceae bacterium]
MKPLHVKIGMAVGVVAVVGGAIALLARSGPPESTDSVGKREGFTTPAADTSEPCKGSPSPYFSADPRGCGSDGKVIFSSKCQECIDQKCKGAETCQGGGFTPEQSALCNEVLDCVDDSRCNDGHFAMFCYCGAVTQEECDSGKAKGACRELIEKGLGKSDPSFVQNNLLDVALPAGRAMARIDCGNSAGCGKLCR